MKNNNGLELGSLILQLINLEILFRDFNNVDLMQELQKQDSEYLEKILNNQEKILQILEEGDSYGRRKRNRN